MTGRCGTMTDDDTGTHVSQNSVWNQDTDEMWSQLKEKKRNTTETWDFVHKAS